MTLVSFTPTQSAKNLTTLPHLREELQITSTDQDGRLGRLIERASDLIATYLQRELRRGDVVETLEPVDDYRQLLRVTPVESVSEVLEDGEEIVAGEDGYLLESKARGAIYRRERWWRQLPYVSAIALTRSPERGQEIYQFTYTGGYWLPDWIGTPPAGAVLLPLAIEQAALDACRDLYYRAQRNTSIASERLGDWSATYRAPSRSGLTEEVESALAQFRRVVQA